MSNDWQDQLAALRGALPDNPAAETPAEQEPTAADTPRRGKLSIAYERKGHGGKQATIIYGFTCSDDELQQIASQLKKSLATGGSARGGEILIQGNRRQEVAKLLTQMGYKL